MTAGQFASRWICKVDGHSDLPAQGARRAQYGIPGQTQPQTQSAPPQIRIPPQVQAALEHPNPYVRQWAVKQVEEYQKLGRTAAYDQWKTQDQRAYEGQVRQQTWNREDQIRAANQEREDRIR